MPKSTNLQPIETLAKMSEADLVKAINEAGAASDLHYRSAVANALLQGVLLSHAKSTMKHGSFKKWIETNLKTPYRTANRRRKFAEAIRTAIQAPKSKSAKLALLPETLAALPTLAYKDRDAFLVQLEKMEELTEGYSLTELQWEFSCCDEEDSKGGKRTVSEKAEDPTPEQLQLALIEDWQQYAATSLDYIQAEDKSWTQLPKVERENLIGILEPFVKQLKSSLR